MKPRIKFLIGGAVILGVAAYLMASSIKTTGVYYVTPQELAQKVAVDPSLVGSGVKMGARVIPGSIRRDPGGREVAFRVSDGDQSYPVVYRGLIPDTFTDSADVVVDGRLGSDGTFRATTLLAKCASRYENAPDKYRHTAGYRQASQALRTGDRSAAQTPE
jgi:cytochrome c-type biogenesis protein CcmE